VTSWFHAFAFKWVNVRRYGGERFHYPVVSNLGYDIRTVRAVTAAVCFLGRGGVRVHSPHVAAVLFPFSLSLCLSLLFFLG
jgi:hypothetical protein